MLLVSILDRPEGRPLLYRTGEFNRATMFQSSIAPKDDRYQDTIFLVFQLIALVSILDRPEGRPLPKQ